ncbi:MAG: chromate transporter [Tannerellaceae bacterium]|jgi:chromate transporter|nr:chromate transporter [Tannerellaceae bacterium]
MYHALFFVFLRIGAFTIGGGYAMLPLIEREVTRRKWMSRENFLDAFAISQTMPGVFAVNMSILIGYRLRKTAGAIVCTLATIIPSFLIILTIAIFFTQVQDNLYVEKIFKALRPVVVALIAVPSLTAAKAAHINLRTAPIPIVVAMLIWAAGISPIYIVILAIAAGLAQHIFVK